MLNGGMSDCSEVFPSCSDTMMRYTSALLVIWHLMCWSMSTHIVVCSIKTKFTLSELVCWHGTALHCGKITAASLKTLFLCLNF